MLTSAMKRRTIGPANRSITITSGFHCVPAGFHAAWFNGKNLWGKAMA